MSHIEREMFRNESRLVYNLPGTAPFSAGVISKPDTVPVVAHVKPAFEDGRCRTGYPK
jgi:hypothetical protein